mmetsp:Transcript_33665/g.81621  ORF Transcript_33665/g.81621 Transcript_33665/m.81621 type:complete len:100 (-) Transcript_33665:2046-2345(-)
MHFLAELDRVVTNLWIFTPRMQFQRGKARTEIHAKKLREKNATSAFFVPTRGKTRIKRIESLESHNPKPTDESFCNADVPDPWQRPWQPPIESLGQLQM